MYTSPTLEYESRVPYQQNNIPLLRKTKDYNTKFPITAEKGFFELPPGGKHTADLRLEIAEWRRFLEAGKTYYMLYTGERRPRWGGKVRYWRYGTFEVNRSPSLVKVIYIAKFY